MPAKKHILVMPSWYATAQWPTNGSFFREQSLLMADDFDITVSVSKKFWISRQRFLFHKWFKRPHTLPTEPLEIQPPAGHTVLYPFCKFATDEENLQAEIEAHVAYITTQFKDCPPALIHAHSAHTAGVVAHGISQKLGIPFVITEHFNPFLLSQFPPFWQDKIRGALENAHGVLAVSEHQRQNILMNGIHCNPITVGNLTNDELFTIPAQRPESAKTRLLIVTYYPNFIKDMDTFFAAMGMLRDAGRHQNLECTIVGGGELSGTYGQNHYTEIIQKNGWQDFLKVVPSANRQEMVTLMQQTDALVSSSIAESFGVAICEAMLCGKPVITTANGGVNDFTDHTNSIRVRVHDPRALADGILEFLDKKHTFNPDTIRRPIVEKYGHEAFKKRIAEVYDTITDKPIPHRACTTPSENGDYAPS